MMLLCKWHESISIPNRVRSTEQSQMESVTGFIGNRNKEDNVLQQWSLPPTHNPRAKQGAGGEEDLCSWSYKGEDT